MIPYLEIGVAGHVIFAACSVVLMLAAVFLLVDAGMTQSGGKSIICTLIPAALMMFIFQGITDVSVSMDGGIKNITMPGRLIGSLPYAAVALSLIMIGTAEILLFWAHVNRRKKKISKDAIKESIDSLPDGVCFYSADGQPLLVNRQMQYISGELFDSEILNVNMFQKRLIKGMVRNNTEILRTEPTVAFRTADGRVWDFHTGCLQPEKSGLYELIAFDITEQYKLREELKQRNERLQMVNERLRRFDREMVSLTAEKELLRTKIDVHDNIGRSLLACRAYFRQKKEERSRDDLLLLWKYVLSVLKKEELPSGEWELLRKTADMLGIEIELCGALPENLKIRIAIAAAIRECLTNTADHAGGDKLFVKITEDGTSVNAELTNTGKPPEGEIHETGGLKNLRRAAEQAGGIMTIENTPCFLLRLEFGKGAQSE